MHTIQNQGQQYDIFSQAMEEDEVVNCLCHHPEGDGMMVQVVRLQKLETGSIKFRYLQGDFFNWDSPENVSRLAPPKFAWTGPPPKLSKCWNHIHFARHLGVFRSEGGPVWDSNVFLKSVTYRPTLSKFRGVPVKKITL